MYLLMIIILIFLNFIPDSLIANLDFNILGKDYLGRDLLLYGLKAIAFTYTLSILSVITALMLIALFTSILMIYSGNKILINIFFLFSSLFFIPFFILAIIVLHFSNNIGVLFLLLSIISFSRSFKILESEILNIASDKQVKFAYTISNSLKKVFLYFILPKFIKNYKKVLVLEVLEISYIFSLFGILGLGLSTDNLSIGILLHEYFTMGDFEILFKILILYSIINLLFIKLI